MDIKNLKKLFSDMNVENVKYVILRNINDIFSDNISKLGDIDLLINKSNYNIFRKIIKENGWKQKKHPLDNGKDFVFLYHLDKFEWFSKDGLYLDVSYKLSCRSINAGEWMPLDQKINNEVWEFRVKDQNHNVYILSPEIQLIHLLTRSIFDKKIFSSNYICEINNLLDIVDFIKVEEYLNLIFFKFSLKLLELIRKSEYSTIIQYYYTFTDY